ncbi:MAG: heavy-metal-associated domain-containing protein [Verrucomicrobia bacterium]|nr:heavy-metal-associated domain-containing protein [Verrucomicrobiota bacterium]MCH8527279.1 heavy-metal-associated domain-containing protein [Kiritimatiellia bacterium]
MKISKIWTALCGLSLLAAVSCVTTDAERVPQINPVPGEGSPEVMDLPVMLEQDAELVVFGLSCPLCASNLETQFRRIPGVAGHQTDLDSGIIHVQVRQGAFVQTEALRRAVADAGFTLREIRLKESL